MRRDSGHHRMRLLHVCHVYEFNIEDEIGFSRDAWMIGTVGNAAYPIRELPRNEDAALAADLHTDEASVEARYDPAGALGEQHWLRFWRFGLAVGTELRFAIFADDRLWMIIP